MSFKTLNKKLITFTLISTITISSIGTTSVKAIDVNTSPVIVTNNDAYNQIDDNMIKTFTNMENEVTELLNSTDSSMKDKAKASFILIVDFIFFDGEINGVKFNQLTEDGKQKVLEIANKIDIKIENKFPNYKDTIATTTKEAFKKAGELISIGASNINNFAKEKLSEDNYNAIINAKDDLVYYTKNAIDLFGKAGDFIWKSTSGLREDISNLIDNGVQKIKDWYENLKKTN